MNQDRDLESVLRALPLDSRHLVLDPETETFFKKETGIQDGEELKKHITEIQEEAYKVSYCRSVDRGFSTRGSNVRCVLCSGFPLSMHSWIQIRESQDCQNSHVSAHLRIAEEPTRRDIFGYRMLQCGLIPDSKFALIS